MAAVMEEEALQKIFEMLGTQYAELHNLKDSEFTDAYMGFRSRMETAIKEFFGAEENPDGTGRSATYVPDLVSSAGSGFRDPVPRSGFRDPVPGSGFRISSLPWSLPVPVGLWAWLKTQIAAGATWIANFFMGEGITPVPRDPNTFSLDPVPFKDMIDYIVKHSQRPDFSNVFTETQSIKDYSKLKSFAKGVVESVAAAGPTQAVVQRQFYNSVVAVLDSIGATEAKIRVQKEVQQYSVEVKRAGTVILGWYRTTFDGEVYKGCCSDDQDVTMRVAVKVWKYATFRELKDEFNRLRK